MRTASWILAFALLACLVAWLFLKAQAPAEPDMPVADTLVESSESARTVPALTPAQTGQRRAEAAVGGETSMIAAEAPKDVEAGAETDDVGGTWLHGFVLPVAETDDSTSVSATGMSGSAGACAFRKSHATRHANNAVARIQLAVLIELPSGQRQLYRIVRDRDLAARALDHTADSNFDFVLAWRERKFLRVSNSPEGAEGFMEGGCLPNHVHARLRVCKRARDGG